MVRRVLVLGSTGSVGRQALDVLDGLELSHRVVGLSAATSARLLSQQAAATGAEAVCLTETQAASGLSLPGGCRLFTGAEGLLELLEATRPDVVVCSITGAAGLPSTLAAAEAGADLALANKESLVLAGGLVKAACARSGARLLPVDSEHSAVFQCLQGEHAAGVRRIVLTASGGPFRGYSAEQLAAVTVEQALDHPCWDMGPRITIDSATLMNKGLEVVEACHLFDVGPELVDVVVHPQSVVHSMVEFVDGAVMAQLGPPDMRLPIRYALGFPERIASGAGPVDITSLSGLTFETPDPETFPCLGVGYRIAREGGLAGAIANAANEVAVGAFLEGRLPFNAIPVLVDGALDQHRAREAPDLPSILAMDAEVRATTAAAIELPAPDPTP
ncbi:MAG: 1-deoxy-D-xylulose-5-phosphate reductoisomerase [Planctomycetota bacterium]|nr:MAG: 1-deoxy-D-xylulose-5-phosphate reductoisomerase [Planctomycetota bacterium]